MDLHLLLIGDVAGWASYHVGDEAMLEANIAQLKARIPEIRLTVVSGDPDWTSEHYRVNAVPRLGFETIDRDDSEAYDALSKYWLQVGADMLERQETDLDEGKAVVTALFNANGLLISGGGNLTSTWPEHIYERVTLIELAKLFHKPVIVLGQTIGPNLDPAHRIILSNALKTVQHVGVRELESMALALSLGVNPARLSYQLDDAFFLDEMPIESSALPCPDPYAIVTFHPFTVPDQDSVALKQIAQQLGTLCERTGLHLLFVPHVPESQGKLIPDQAVGEVLATQLPSHQMTVLEVQTARQVVGLTQHASMIISTRYHPLVFGLANAVPAIGIYVDAYTRIKLRGALEHGGLEQWTLPVELAIEGGLLEAATELWATRENIVQHLRLLLPTWQEANDARWKQITKIIALKTNGRNEINQAPTFRVPLTKTDIDMAPQRFWRQAANVIERLRR